MSKKNERQEYLLRASIVSRVRVINESHSLWPYLIEPNRQVMAGVFIETEVHLQTGEVVEFDFLQKKVKKIFRGRGRVVRTGANGAVVRVLEVMSLDKPLLRSNPTAEEASKKAASNQRIEVLPDDAKIEELLVSLIGSKIKVAEKPRQSDPTSPVIGTYLSDQGKLLALVVTDVAATNYLGASLARIPAGAAAAAIRTNTIEEEMRDNCYEILNVGASLFNLSGGVHVKLSALLVPPTPLPPDIAELMQTPRMRKDIEVIIPLYETCRMAIYIA
ncbi:MAG: hypothetical protein WCT04_15095 [Planctomycetota bacterium]